MRRRANPLARTKLKRCLEICVEHSIQGRVHSRVGKKHQNNNVVRNSFKMFVDVRDLKSSNEVDGEGGQGQDNVSYHQDQDHCCNPGYLVRSSDRALGLGKLERFHVVGLGFVVNLVRFDRYPDVAGSCDDERDRKRLKLDHSI